MTRTVYAVRGGRITQEQINDGLYPQEALGHTEWQFSDGPPGKRTYSADFWRLDDALAAHEGMRVMLVD